MLQFDCRFLSETGQVIDDTFEAENITALKNAFLQRGCKLISFSEKKKSALNMAIGKQKLKMKNVILFCRQMATLLKAGIPLIKCFDILLGQTKDKLLLETLKTLSLDVQSGTMLSVSMTKMDGRFPSMLIKMIEIGEATGNLESILDRMANKYEKDDNTRKKIKSAMTYPILLIVMALGAAIFMLTSIVPQFAGQFAQMGAELPAITQAMLNVSNSLTQRWYIYLIVIAAVVIIINRIFAIEAVKKKFAYFLFAKSPIKGPLSKIVCAQISRTLNILITSGIPIVHALGYVANNVNNLYVKDCLQKVAVGMQEGKGFAEQIEAFGTFPSLFVSMISIGEQSGKLEEMLSKTADYYDGETDQAVAQLMALIQPIMIVIVGGLIGLIVIAMYSPMFGMYEIMG